MFEVKYDKNGVPIKNESVAQEFNAQADAAVEQPVENTEAITDSLDALEQAGQDQPEIEEAVQQPIQNETPKKPQQSFAELRKQREEEKARREAAERERDEAINYIRQLHQQAPAQQQPQPESVDEFNLPDDDIVEAKHVKKVVNEYKKLRQEFNEYKRQSTEMTIEATLRAKFPDFDKVVTVDNLKALRDADPEEAALIHQSGDNYLKASAAYKAIKRIVVQNEPQQESVTVEKSMAQKNAVKPKPVASISPQQGANPLSKANAFAQGLTKELADQLRKEMEEARKQY
jgi:hypothetical protein